MRHRLLALLMGLCLFAGAGCQSMGLPRLFGPGSAPYQRGVAQQYDPYPETDVAPEIVGGRPREYQQPVAEPARARWLQWSFPRF